MCSRYHRNRHLKLSSDDVHCAAYLADLLAANPLHLVSEWDATVDSCVTGSTEAMRASGGSVGRRTRRRRDSGRRRVCDAGVLPGGVREVHTAPGRGIGVAKEVLGGHYV